jgi:two-component system, NtrC family, sensor kinase
LISAAPFFLNLVIVLSGFGLVSKEVTGSYEAINAYFVFFAFTIYIASKYARKSKGWLFQLDETRKLAEQNLEKEREKQQILAIQNETLEQQVKQRTSELTKSLKDLKETQSQLVQSEKMASLGDLTAGIAHEIQNPLNFVNNFSDVNTELIDEMNESLDKGDLNEARTLSFDIRDNQEKISHHGRRADSIVKSMLQHSRASTGQKESTDINALADEYFRLSYHGLRAKDKLFNANLISNLDASVGEMLIVPQDMGRVFLNLFNNAFYSVFQKKIRLVEQNTAVEETSAYDPSVWLTTSRKENSIEISIRDNGLGVPAKILNKIFQPFFTSKPVGQGTGLGLSLSYDIVTQEHGGDLTASSVEGEYAEFVVVLPIVD